MKRARPNLTMEQRRQQKRAMTGTERSRRSRERKAEREAAEGTTKRDRFRDESKVHMHQQAIRAGVEVHQVNRCWRDRGGELHEMREILFADVYPEQALEDGRQAQAEADGSWPEFTMTDSQ